MNARKLSLAVIVPAALATLAFGAVPSAGSPARHRRVTIHTGGLYGYVRSPRPRRCASNRKVGIFKQAAGSWNPGGARRVTVAITRRSRSGYRWSSNAVGTGSFYAQTQRRAGCRVVRSKTVTIPPTPGALRTAWTAGVCPTLSSYDFCSFGRIRTGLTGGAAPLALCPSFIADFGGCAGQSTGGPYPLNGSGLYYFRPGA